MELHVKFDYEIIVTRPGTDMMTAYRKAHRPNLILTRSWGTPAISEFRSHAFKAAVSKARELGWIV